MNITTGGQHRFKLSNISQSGKLLLVLASTVILSSESRSTHAIFYCLTTLGVGQFRPSKCETDQTFLKIEIIVFWDVTPCSLIFTDVPERHAVSILGAKKFFHPEEGAAGSSETLAPICQST
jgi:hypothetical protein